MKKVLVFRNDEIGDFLLWLPYAQQLRKYYADAHITIVVKPHLSLLAKYFPFFDRIVELPKYHTRGQWLGQIILLFFKIFNRYDIVINPMLDVRTNECFLGAFFSRQKYHLVMPQLNQGTALQQRINQKLPFFNRTLTIADWESIFEINRKLLALVTGNDTEISCEGVLDRFLLRPNDLTVFGIGGSDPRRRWPTEHWRLLARQLLKQDDKAIIALVGDQNDRANGEIIRDGHDRVVNYCGKTTLPELLDIVCNCRRVISHDTAVAHLGALGGIDTVIIAGGGHWGIFVPYPKSFTKVKTAARIKDCFGCNWCCFEHGSAFYPCLREIAPNEVLPLIKSADTLKTLPANT